ncbi:MAG: hypothetical protein JXA69_17240 [Phycisphaerae bacterium]|nr:hypothetical protein [Phycisphaerae bacterium]
MSDYLNEGAEEEFRQRVRGTAMWAGIGGALMLYFGMNLLTLRLDSKLCMIALHTELWTLRLGGGAMLCVAALCLSGWSVALLFDAIACTAIAILLTFAGGVLLVHGYWDGLLMLLFAALFGNSAFRSWRDYMAWRQLTLMPQVHAEVAVPHPPITDGAHSAVASLRRKKDVRAAAKRASEAANVATARPVTPVRGDATPQRVHVSPPPAVVPVAMEPPEPHAQPGVTESSQPEPSPTTSEPAEPTPTSEPDTEPAEGFLAALAREDKKDQPKE